MFTDDAFTILRQLAHFVVWGLVARKVWARRETDRVGTSAPMGTPRVAALWRYPVKSFQGEPIAQAEIDEDGLRGDRCWGVRDEASGRILTARREPRLLLASAVLTDDGLPEITIPDGQRVRGTGVLTDSALSAWLRRPVTLVGAQGAPGASAEFFADATDDTSAAIEWTMPPGRFVDAMALLVLTTSSLRAGAEIYPAGDWHPRRFRPNVLVDTDGDGWIEDEWCGRKVQVGTVEVLPREPCSRCTMVTRAQPDLERDLEIFKTLRRHHNATLGVWTQVAATGTARVGDPVLIS